MRYEIRVNVIFIQSCHEEPSSLRSQSAFILLPSELTVRVERTDPPASAEEGRAAGATSPPHDERPYASRVHACVHEGGPVELSDELDRFDRLVADHDVDVMDEEEPTRKPLVDVSVAPVRVAPSVRCRRKPRGARR
jgi:hypothetical protein